MAREIDSFSAIKRYVRKDGAAVWVELTVSLVRGTDGAPSYEIALFEDISLRRQAEEALQRSERRFRALIENSADGILLADGAGRVMYGSPGARRTLGYAKGETLGWPIEVWTWCSVCGRIAPWTFSVATAWATTITSSPGASRPLVPRDSTRWSSQLCLVN